MKVQRWLVSAGALTALLAALIPYAVAQYDATAKTVTFTVAVRPGMHTPDLTCRVRNVRGELVRSSARKNLFLRAIGRYPQPAGMYVDHLYPLGCGGCDVPSNMQLLSEAAWKAKTSWERRVCGQ